MPSVSEVEGFLRRHGKRAHSRKVAAIPQSAHADSPLLQGGLFIYSAYTNIPTRIIASAMIFLGFIFSWKIVTPKIVT